MYTVIIATILAASLFAVYWHRVVHAGTGRLFKIGSTLYMTAAGGLVGCLIGMVVALTFGSCLSTMQEDISPATTLVAMRSADGFTGAFMLGSGTVQSGHSYLFYTKNSDGSLTPVEIAVNALVHIVEDQNLANTGSWTTTVRKRVNTSKYGLQNWMLVEMDSRVIREEFHVPVGTVVQNFKVN